MIIQQQQRVTAAHAHGISWGGYTVVLSWPRSVLVTNEELRAFCRHYGPVRGTWHFRPTTVSPMSIATSCA